MIPNFIYRALHQKKLPITGTGEETIDFPLVEDIVDGTLRLGIIQEAVGEAFHLASEKEIRIIDISNIINEITGNHNGMEFTVRRDSDKISSRRASIEKASKVVSYEPNTKIKEGINKVYDWTTENRDKIEADARF